MAIKGKVTRRDLLKLTGLSGSTLLMNQWLNCSVAQAAQKIYQKPFNKLKNQTFNLASAPMQNIEIQKFYSKDFNGDEVNDTHKIFWNIDGYIQSKGGLPQAKEFAPVVIVGGGLSGLLSAYYLRDRNPIVLESAQQFGGNAKGEFFENTRFSIGTAYITKPEVGSEVDQLLHELKLQNVFRQEESAEAKVSFKSKMFDSFWDGATDPVAKEQFIKIYQDLSDILENRYPEIPFIEDVENQKQVMAWDQLSFADWIKQEWGEIHPHIREYFQLYCWSSFGGSIDEISAAQALNFLAAETDAILAFPGGNAAIGQALYENLSLTLTPGSLRASSMVIDIREKENELFVTYVDANGDLKAIRTEKCIVASSKMLARTIIPHMAEEQKKACDEITYRAYLVANILVEKPFQSPCFDLFCLEGEVPPSPSALKPPQRGFTDICFGSWANDSQAEYGILTIYKPLAYQGARQFLFADFAHEKHKKHILESLDKYFTQLNLAADQIKGVRLTRWGHAMPLAEKQMISSGVLARARAPINGKIFFANQDNWANPSFETAIASALEVRAFF